MSRYIYEETLKPAVHGFIYTQRTFPGRKNPRHGLIVAVDLEHYDYSRNSQSLIRATEDTIEERLPPRVRIRENAPIEIPHIMILIDDKDSKVIAPFAESVKSMRPLYDFPLMFDSGHLSGWAVEGELLKSPIEALLSLQSQCPMLYAVGDGNHSLAAAKSFWEHKKQALSSDGRENHPARYALAELINIHDDGLIFEPIHRLVRTDNVSHLIESLRKTLENHGIPMRYDPNTNTADFPGVSTLKTLDVLQPFLEGCCDDIDYIHGTGSLKTLSSMPGFCGFLMEPIKKSSLFDVVQKKGTLPKKAFSLGEAHEKRFYLESRKIL